MRIVAAAPVPAAAVDELAAPLLVALDELPLELAPSALTAITVPPWTSAGALLELVPAAADM